MSDLEQAFNDALNRVNNEDSEQKPSNDLKLEMYALFKQATEGDVHGKKPGVMDIVGKAKYNAWKKIKGVSQESAMQSYIEKVDSFFSD
jgi:Acyl-CoA-binding protein